MATTPLDGPVPKHVQLRDALAQAARGLDPGDPLPGERALMSSYAVSRATVRRAIEALVADGVVQRVQGKGTFVARPRVESHLHLASFTQDMRRRGLTPSTRVVAVERREPPHDVAQALALPTGRPAGRESDGASAWLVERVRLADGEPMAYERGWYPADLLPDLGAQALDGSLYALFAERYGLVVDRAEQTARAEQAQSAARLLAVAATAPVMVFERTSRAGERTVEHICSWYRGDRYQVHMSLDRAMRP